MGHESWTVTRITSAVCLLIGRSLLLRKDEAQQFAFKREGGRFVRGEPAVPAMPRGRHEASLRRRDFDPALRCFFAEEDGECGAGGGVAGKRFPLVEACRQAFRQRFMWVEAKNPSRRGKSKIVIRGFSCLGGDYACAIFASDLNGPVAGTVVDDEDVVAGIERLEGAAHPHGVVFRVQYCRDREHERLRQRVYVKRGKYSLDCRR